MGITRIDFSSISTIFWFSNQLTMSVPDEDMAKQML
jgi:hypothetical protein